MTTGIPSRVADLIRESQSAGETFTAQEMVQLSLYFAYFTKNYYEYAAKEATNNATNSIKYYQYCYEVMDAISEALAKHLDFIDSDT